MTLTKINLFLKEKLLRNTASLLGGSISGQFLLLLSYFLVARWFGPEPSGLIKIFTSLSLTFSLLVNGGYELAVMLPQNVEVVKKMIKRAFKINLYLSISALLLLLFFGSWLVSYFQLFDYLPIAGLLVVSICLEGSITLLHNYLIRHEAYRFVAFSLFAYAFVFSILVVLMLFIPFEVYYLVLAYILAQITKVGLYLYKSKSLGVFKLKEPNSDISLAPYKDYPTFHLASSVTNYASREMVVPLLGFYFGVGISGLFAMAIQILNLPMRFLLQAFPQVFYQRIAQLCHSDTQLVRGETIKALFLLFFMSLLPTVFLALIGPWLFSIILGPEWYEAGTYLIYLVPFAIVSSMASPLTSIINVKYKLKSFFIVNILFLVTRLGAIFLGYYWGSHLLAIKLYGLSSFLGATFLFIWLLSLAGLFKKAKY